MIQVDTRAVAAGSGTVQVGSEGVSGIELYLLDRSHTTHPQASRRRGEGQRGQADGDPKERGASGVQGGVRGAFWTVRHTTPTVSRLREVGVEDSYEARELAQRGR